MFNLETASLEDKIMHYLVRLANEVSPKKVKASRLDFDAAIISLGDKGYVTYRRSTHELYKGETENIKPTKKGEEYYNRKFNF